MNFKQTALFSLEDPGGSPDACLRTIYGPSLVLFKPETGTRFGITFTSNITMNRGQRTKT